MKNNFIAKTGNGKRAQSSTRYRGFTLIEVMVALAIFTVLMVVIFVPLTQAARFLSVGRTRASLQQSANQTVTQLQRDLSRAIYVYPNDNLPGVTDKLPYSTTGLSVAPYFRGAVRDATTGNTSRLDMLLPELDVNGNVKYPITPAKYIVTYYVRRSDLTTAANAYNNPVVLFRAQYPYTNRDRSVAAIDTSSGRYGAMPGNIAWLRQGSAGLYSDEFDLSGLCIDSTTPLVPATNPIVTSSHAVVTPRNVALITPTIAVAAGSSLSPNTTFTCSDTNGDGKINQVGLSLTITNFNRQVSGDGGNNSDPNLKFSDNVNFQKFTLNQTMDVPNIR